MTADHTVAEDGYQERDDCAEAVAAARADEQVLLSDLIAEAVAAARAEALGEARDDIKARIVTFRKLNADQQYLNALNDAWGLVANRTRAALEAKP